eukprot:1754814-Rhodomonas_salina.2
MIVTRRAFSPCYCNFSYWSKDSYGILPFLLYASGKAHIHSLDHALSENYGSALAAKSATVNTVTERGLLWPFLSSV